MNTVVDKRVFVYVWGDGTYCYEEDLEEYLMFLQSDDFRKVYFGQPDYPAELCD